MMIRPGSQFIILFSIGVLSVVLASPPATSAEPNRPTPWWKTEKVCFYWGQWDHLGNSGMSANAIVDQLAQVGATVMAEGLHPAENRRTTLDGGLYYHLPTAQAAKKRGIRYFATAYVTRIVDNDKAPKSRPSMNSNGKPYVGRQHPCVLPCPLDEDFYEAWFAAPAVRLAKSGFIDGLHMDWEAYVGRCEAGICYCDACFRTFMVRKGIESEIPAAEEQRYTWLEQKKIVSDYHQSYIERRTEMFRKFERAVHAVHPTFVFSGYYMRPALEICRALHTLEVPFFLVDDRHYYEDGLRPWWDSKQANYDRQGFLRIAGTWNQTFFGGDPLTQVSLSKWMYDAAMHADGLWVWFEQEVTPETWRAFWLGHRKIAAVEAKVGKYLLQGERDPNFVTMVEWTGSPHRISAIKHVSYHLDDEHLVHVQNVDSDRPVTMRLRFGQLERISKLVFAS